MECKITDEWSYRGFKTVIMENEFLRAVFIPELGAKLHEFVYKPEQRDFLYHHPRVECRAPVFDVNVDNWWTGGLDEAIPTGHPCEYKGEKYPFLGEAWSLPWEYKILNSLDDEVSFYLRRPLVISPLIVERWVSLKKGELSLSLKHRITNEGIAPFEFLWGIHPSFSITQDFRIDIPAGEMMIEDSFPDDRFGVSGTRYKWPYAKNKDGTETDMRVVRSRESGTMDFQYATELKAGWLALTDTKCKTGIGLIFNNEIFKSIWLWLVYGGWRNVYTATLEAWTGYPAKISKAVDHGKYSVLKPGNILETETKLIVFKNFIEVSHIDTDGNVSGVQ
jgi:hypothetical protein